MKKNIFHIIFLSMLILIAVFVPPAFAAKAVVLSDEELDGISAQGFDVDINAVSAFRSAVAAQSNIGAVVAKTGDINDTTINNTNVCDIINIDTTPGNAVVNSANFTGPMNLAEINAVYADGSAVAAQSNIAVMAAMQGSINNSEINNLNQANVFNLGNSAVANQSNIAVVMAQGNVSGATINNTNIANLTNTYNTITKKVQSYSLSYKGIEVKININNVLANGSAIATQTNIDVIGSLNGNVLGSSIHNSNIATVHNLP